MDGEADRETVGPLAPITAVGAAVGIGAGLVLVWFTMVPPHPAGTASRVVGVLLVVVTGSIRYRVHYVRNAVESWRSLFWGVLTAVLTAGYALLYPGVGVALFAAPVVSAVVVWFVAILVKITSRFRENRADAVAGALAIVVVCAAAAFFGATPGRQLRLLTVQDRYEAAIAAGRVGDEAGTSAGDPGGMGLGRWAHLGSSWRGFRPCRRSR